VRATEGKRVKIRFKCRREDGTRYVISETDTLEFVIGEGKTLPSLEKGVLGMQPGERRTIRVPVTEIGEFPFSEEHAPAEPHSHTGMRKLQVGPENEEDTVILPPPARLTQERPPDGLFLLFEVTVAEVEGEDNGHA